MQLIFFWAWCLLDPWIDSYLETVADSENGDTEVKDTGIDAGSIVIVDGVRASRENDTYKVDSVNG